MLILLQETCSHRLETQDTLAFLQICPEWHDVHLEDVIDQDGGDSDNLSGSCGHDGHEDQEQHSILSGCAQQFLGH